MTENQSSAIYFASRNDIVTVIEHGDALKVVGRNDLKERISASPAITGDTIYLRTAAHLYAFRASRSGAGEAHSPAFLTCQRSEPRLTPSYLEGDAKRILSIQGSDC